MTEAKQYPTEPGALITRVGQPELNGSPADDEIIDANPDYLTLDEVDAVEEMLNGPIDNMNKMPRRGPALRVIATTIKRRTDPSFPLDQAGSLKIRFGESKVVPPTSGDGSGPTQP